MSRRTSFCFTLNNYTELELETLNGFLQRESKYSIFGYEKAPDTGTPHLQGFFILKRRHTFNSVRDLLGSRFHLEGARGTARQNRKYCSKSGTFVETGEIPAEGRRTGSTRADVARSFVERLGEGSSGLSQFADEYPDQWYFHGSQLLRNAQSLVPPIERPDVAVEWVHGAPGVGKSRYAHAKYPNAYIKEPRTKWWNGYLQEKEVIIDDFGPGGIDINHLLRWFDRYKCLVECKGGMLALHATKFIVTSNFRPSEIFKWGDEVNPQLPALLRRVSITFME